MWNRKSHSESLLEKFWKPKTETFEFDLIQRYFQKKINNSVFQVISDQTCNDLDLDELFKQLDRTQTPIGQQYLYHKLRTIKNNPAFNRQEQTATFFSNNTESLQKVLKILSPLSERKAHYIQELFQGDLIKKPKWINIVPLLTFTMLASTILGFFNASILILPVILFPINAVLHYFNKRNVNLYLDSIPQLLVMNKVGQRLKKFKTLEPYFSGKKKAFDTLNEIKGHMSLFRLEQKVDSDLEVIYWFFLELFKIFFLLEPLLFYLTIDKIKNRRTEIEEVFCTIGSIDSDISLISYRASLPYYSTPNKVSDTLRSEGLFHPLIDKCVLNDLNISDKNMLITGSNMSGKTTFMRSVGLNLLCSLSLNTSFSKNTYLPKLKIMTSMRIADDLMGDKSYFLAEAELIQEMIQNGKVFPNHIFLIDEIFKGTNAKERIASSSAVLNHLSLQNNYLLVATHDLELTELCKDYFNNYYFSEQVIDDRITFDYKIRTGRPNEGNAIKILELIDYPQSVTNTAQTILKAL